MLTAKAVEGSALPLERIDDIHGSDSLAPGVLSVSDGVSDDILQKDFQYSPGLFVDESANALNASSPGKTSDGRLGNTLDVIPQYLPVPLRSSLSQTLTTLAAARHCYCFFTTGAFN